MWRQNKGSQKMSGSSSLGPVTTSPSAAKGVLKVWFGEAREGGITRGPVGAPQCNHGGLLKGDGGQVLLAAVAGGVLLQPLNLGPALSRGRGWLREAGEGRAARRNTTLRMP